MPRSTPPPVMKTIPRTVVNLADLVPLSALVLMVFSIVWAAQLNSTPILLGMTALTVAGLLVLLTPHFSASSPDISAFLIVPTAISAFQNVYLSLASANISGTDLQLVVIVNFIYAAALYLVLAARDDSNADPARSQLARKVTFYMVVLAAYGFFTVVLFHTQMMSAVASARNIVAPLLFFLIGIHASRWTVLTKYLRYLVWVGLAAVGFGFIEMNTPGFWQSIGLPLLWEHKGIPISAGTGLPSNFHASEQVDGQFVRRMAGPFADPVNFGTFLFSVFMAAWFLKNRLMTLLVMVASGFAVSKGALLGFLVWLAFWTRYYAPRFIHVLSIMAAVGAGLGFYVFTLGSSTGSTTAHINGFLAAFVELPQHPLGRGMGGVGVLAGLFAEGAESTSEITESGIGMILGQLGIIGFLVYVAFFGVVLRYAFRLRDVRQRLLATSLVGAFILNASFNEVALSPNSSATYFIILGLVIGMDLVGQEVEVKEVKKTRSHGSNQRRRVNPRSAAANFSSTRNLKTSTRTASQRRL